MTIEMIKVKFFEEEVEKLLVFFPELKSENFLLLSENDTRRKTFWNTFPLISENEMEIVSVKKSETPGIFEFGTKGDVIIFRDAMPTEAEQNSMEKSILQTLAEFIEILEKTSISDVVKKEAFEKSRMSQLDQSACEGRLVQEYIELLCSLNKICEQKQNELSEFDINRRAENFRTGSNPIDKILRLLS